MDSLREPSAMDPPTAARRGKPARSAESWLGLSVLVATVAAFLLLKRLETVHPPPWQDSSIYHVAIIRYHVILLGASLGLFLLTPAMDRLVDSVRARWRKAYTCLALCGICAFLWAFVMHIGRFQFGAYDQGITIDAGWRGFLGQRPYVDYPTTTPPGFDLSAKYAFQLFGVRWDALIYTTAIFACVTYLWMYGLMVRIGFGELAAMAMAFSVESAGVLLLCFWWYNDTTMIMVAVFFLSCVLWARDGGSRVAQLSYCLSLAALSLLKPNIAGLAMVGGIFLLFLAVERKLRLLGVTLLAAAMAIAFLFVNHISIPAMIATYRAIATERAFNSFGSQHLDPIWRRTAYPGVVILCFPMLCLVPRFRIAIRQRDVKAVAFFLLFPLTALIAAYGVNSNGELRDIECTALLAAGGVLVFGLRWTGPISRRLFVGIVCAGMVGDMYVGAIRVRLMMTGWFFYWRNNDTLVVDGFFKNLRVSPDMMVVERQVTSAMTTGPGPYLFGPLLTFNYAARGIPSPLHQPPYWQGGTSYPLSWEPEMIREWQARRFETLIYLRGGRVNYPKELDDIIDRDYVLDETYPRLDVYHRRK